MPHSPGHYIIIAHGTVAAIAMAFLFPLGAIGIRLLSHRKAWVFHSAWQTFALAVFTAAVGMGIYTAVVTDAGQGYLTQPHAIIGLIVFGVMFIQLVLGYLHHARYRKVEKRTTASWGHLWVGRAAITLGMINVGLGLQLSADASSGQLAAYGVVAGLIWLVYVGVVVWDERRRSRRVVAVNGEKS